MSDLDAATTKLLEEAKALAADAAVHATKAETAATRAIDAAQDAGASAKSARDKAIEASVFAGNADQSASEAAEEAEKAAEQATQAVTKIEEALGGDVAPPVEPPVTEGLILEAESITEPQELHVGELLGTKTIVGVMRVPAGDGTYRKLIGADGTTGMFGGLCVGQAGDGQAEFWLDNGAGTVQIRHPSRPDKRSFFALRITELAFAALLDANNRTIECVPVPFDGICALGKGIWKHQWADEAVGAELVKVEIYSKLLTWEEIEAKRTAWAGFIDPIVNGGGGNGGNGGNGGGGPVEGDLEPVKPGVDQVAIQVGIEDRQVWHAIGWGAGPANEAGQVHPLIMRHAKQLYEEIPTKAIRLIDPNAGSFISAYKPLTDFARDKGVDTIIATGFYRRNGYSAKTLGEKVAAAVRAGIQITHVCAQNEPDGSPKNQIILANLPQDYRDLRKALDDGGARNVKIITNEYAHYGDQVKKEYDTLKAAGVIGSVVAFGSGHCYRDCPSPKDYEQSWGKTGTLSMESGYLANPHAGARVICAMNGGAIVEIAHLAQSRSMSDTDLSQKLLKADGTRMPFHAQYAIIGQAVPRGSVFRHCTSSDRPAGLPEHIANGMLRVSGSHRNPRINVAVCKRPTDGTVAILACNTTVGGGVPSYLGACYAADVLQATVSFSVPDRMLTVKRCNSAGAISAGGKIPFKGGKARFTLNPGETLTAVG